jgi:hypothetical protein
MSADPENGYRDAPERPLAVAPTGALLSPTTADVEALDRVRSRERSSAAGMVIGALILVRWVAPFLSGALLILDLVAAAGLFLYALASFASPRGIGPFVIRLAPDGEIVAGFRFGVAIALRPKSRLDLDPLLVRLVARKSENGRESVVYESEHLLAERQVIRADQAARIETSFLLPEDAPPTSANPRVRWRVELSIGRPAVFERSIAVRVRAPKKRRRPKETKA